MINIELDLALLKLLLQRSNYDKYRHVIDFRSIANDAKTIIHGYDEYYKGVNKDEINFLVFVPWFFSRLHADMLEDEIIHFKEVFSRIHETSIENVEEIIKLLNQRVLWDKLEGFKKEDFNTFKMEELLNSFNEHKLAEAQELDDDVFRQSFEERIVRQKNKYIPWPLEKLNDHLVGIPKGQFVLVCGGKDSGKSAFGVDIAAYIANKLPNNKSVLYFNNEQPDADMDARIKDRIVNKNAVEVSKYLEYCKNNLEKVEEVLFPVYNKIYLLKSSGKNTGFYDQKCKQYNPGIIILDQIDNIKHSLKGSAEFRPYEGLYSWVRDLAKKYDCPLIGFTQAKNGGKIRKLDGTTVYKEKICLDDAAGSNVDKQAHLDVFIGIGCSNDYENVRIINIDSFKDSGCKKGSFACQLIPHVSRFKD